MAGSSRRAESPLEEDDARALLLVCDALARGLVHAQTRASSRVFAANALVDVQRRWNTRWVTSTDLRDARESLHVVAGLAQRERD